MILIAYLCGMRSNKVNVTVVFNDRLNNTMYSTPTFLEMFDRITEIRNRNVIVDKEYTFVTNNTHKGLIERMYMNFKCIKSVKFS